MTKILHVVSGTIIETELPITKNTLNYLFYMDYHKVEKNDKEWARLRRFIDLLDDKKIICGSVDSYYYDLQEIRKTMCEDEFEFLD